MSTGGRIVTFYSYKGGTGRTMALANIAWMLAAAGKRVLTIDWDMEAPGLHRYFHPFLADPEATSTPGIIDFVTEFAVASTQLGDGDEDWYLPYADLSRYAVSLVDTPGFPASATLDFISSGQQGSAYAARANSFDWQSFWDRQGGAVLLRETANRLREDYDYVLIDSRTGVSDTSGICTIVLPDTLVVAYTLNRQSIRGAAAVAQSVVAQRDRTRFRVYPVPMRVEFSEKDRLELARSDAQREFEPFLWHIGASERQRYWGAVEVIYHPYYAYEEVLAIFADRPDQRTSLLAALEQVTAYLTDNQVKAAVPPTEPERRRALALYQRQPQALVPDTVEAPPRAGHVYISAASTAQEFALHLTDALESGSPAIRVWLPVRDDSSGDDLRTDEAIAAADCVLTTVTGDDSPWQLRERKVAVEYGRPVVPLVLEPEGLRASADVAGGQAIDFTGDFDTAVATLRSYLAYIRSPEGERATLVRRLDEARRELPTAVDSERVRLEVLVEDLEAQLRSKGGADDEATVDEFVLRLGGNDRIAARWRGAAVNSAVATDDLQRRLLQLFTDLLREGRLTKRREVQLTGELLYARVFPGAVGSLLGQALDAATPDRPLRLAIAIEPDAGVGFDLPWELLYKPPEGTTEGSFLASSSTLLLSRAPVPELVVPAPEIADDPMRVLVAAYGAEERHAWIETGLEALATDGSIELIDLRDRPLSTVLDAADEQRPAVVHLITGARSGADETEFEMAEFVGPDWIPASRLVDLVSGLEAKPAMIVLQLDPVDPASWRGSDLAMRLVNLGIAGVLEIASPLWPRVAGPFFKTLYDQLAAGEPIDGAVSRARRHLTRRVDSPDFAYPVLFMNYPGPIASAQIASASTAPVVRQAPVLTPDVGGEAIDPAIRRRLRRALQEAQPWRTLERLAIEAAVPEEIATRVLRADDDVRFSRNRDGRTIVGLISRVGARPAVRARP